MDKIKRYKVLGKGGIPCNGGKGKWNLPKDDKPGKWMPKLDNIEPCVSGYHLCRMEDLIYWLNKEIYEAEGRGEFIRHNDNKDVFAEARLLKKMESWNERSARLFSLDCAEHVLDIFEKQYPNDDRPRKAIKAARKFANGKINTQQLAASMDEAWAAARAAAMDLAASMDVAWAAVWAAEHKWQTGLLKKYLEE